MLQIYFLSIVLNAFAGFLLISEANGGVPRFKEGLPFKDETLRLITGVLTVIVGFLKLLAPVRDGETVVYVIGDLIPALAGFLAGFILIFEYYRTRSSVEAMDQTEKIDRILISNKRIIGFAAVIVAALHFLFARFLLL